MEQLCSYLIDWTREVKCETLPYCPYPLPNCPVSARTSPNVQARVLPELFCLSKNSSRRPACSSRALWARGFAIRQSRANPRGCGKGLTPHLSHPAAGMCVQLDFVPGAG